MPELSAEQTPEGWDSVVETYEKAFEPFTAQFAEAALGLARLERGDRVLDIAAGPGALTLAAARAGAHVVATDFSPRMVERLRARLASEGVDNATAEVMDAQALTFPDGAFDKVFSALGVMFFPDRARALREMLRVLEPGGRVGLIVWASPFRLVEFFRRAFESAAPDITPPGPPRGIVELQDRATFESEIRDAGFGDVTIDTVARTWTTPSARWLWAHAPGCAPVYAAVFDRLDEATRDAVGRAFVDLLSEEFGDGPVRIEREAHIAIGVK